MLFDFAHKEHPLVAITNKAVIPRPMINLTGREIQKILKDQIPWAPVFTGATNQFKKMSFVMT
jgi:hypothetical protein